MDHLISCPQTLKSQNIKNTTATATKGLSYQKDDNLPTLYNPNLFTLQDHCGGLSPDLFNKNIENLSHAPQFKRACITL